MNRALDSTMGPVNVPPDMIYEIAAGIGTPLEIVQKYGYTDKEFIVLMGTPWFERAVLTAKEELTASGFTFERRMAMLAEDLMINCYHAAKSPDIAISTKLDVAKQLAKLGKLEPNNSANVNPNANHGFAITINFRGAPPVHLDAHANAENTPIADSVQDLEPIIDDTPTGPDARAPLHITMLPQDDDLESNIPDEL